MLLIIPSKLSYDKRLFSDTGQKRQILTSVGEVKFVTIEPSFFRIGIYNPMGFCGPVSQGSLILGLVFSSQLDTWDKI